MRRPPAMLATVLLASAFVFASGAGGVFANASADDARTEYRELQKEFEVALTEFEAELEKLEEAGDEAAVAAYRADWSPRPAFAELFLERAEAYAGTKEAVAFLTWVVREGPIELGSDGGTLSDSVESALDTMIRDHAEDPSFGAMIDSLGYTAGYGQKVRNLAVLDGLLAKAPTPELGLRTRLARGIACVVVWDRTAEEAAAGRADLEHVREAGAGTPMAEEAAGYLFELENLQIGCAAPEIEGADLDGVEFKLSDYRGKVVVLDFWGDW